MIGQPHYNGKDMDNPSKAKAAKSKRNTDLLNPEAILFLKKMFAIISPSTIVTKAPKRST